MNFDLCFLSVSSSRCNPKSDSAFLLARISRFGALHFYGRHLWLPHRSSITSCHRENFQPRTQQMMTDVALSSLAKARVESFLSSSSVWRPMYFCFLPVKSRQSSLQMCHSRQCWQLSTDALPELRQERDDDSPSTCRSSKQITLRNASRGKDLPNWIC